MLVHRGTLRVGDAIVAGDAWGKVRALHDFRGEKVNDATPGDPIEILGFDHPPPAGEVAKVVENERQARHFAQVRGERLRREQLAQGGGSGGISLETLFSQLQEGGVQDLNLVLKGDVVGSVEAAISELGKIQHPEVRVNVIHQGVGGITENDIMLASASNAMVVGFNVRPNAEARQLADREGVEIRTYRVIYQLTEDIEQALVGMLKPVRTEETIGEVEVRQLFRVSRLGTIAGLLHQPGEIDRAPVDARGRPGLQPAPFEAERLQRRRQLARRRGIRVIHHQPQLRFPTGRSRRGYPGGAGRAGRRVSRRVAAGRGGGTAAARQCGGRFGSRCRAGGIPPMKSCPF